MMIQSEMAPKPKSEDAVEVLKRAEGARALRDAARTWGDATRDRVCTPARGFAGKPSDYAYHVNERCTLVDPKARAEAQNKKRGKDGKAAKAAMPTLAATRREIAQLERVVNLHYGGVMPVNEGPMSPNMLPLIVYMMLRPSTRLAQPDPELRFAEVQKQIESIDSTMPGRFTVLNIVKNALQASVGDLVKPMAVAVTRRKRSTTTSTALRRKTS
jgi:hypothetical protein